MLRLFDLSTVFLVLLIGYSMTADCNAIAASNTRPFWTEKSSYVEADDLYVVGVASNVRTMEEGRLKAFEHGKIELMNFAQVTDLEAQGLLIETQMTYEEQNPEGSIIIFRLLRVPLPKLLEIQRGRAAKLEQHQKEVKQLLAGLSGPGAFPRVTSNALSLTDQLKATEALLDQQEMEMEKVSRRARERVNSERTSLAKMCSLLIVGMTNDEVEAVFATRPLYDPRVGLDLFESTYQWSYTKGMYTLDLKFDREGRLYNWSYFTMDASDLMQRNIRPCTGPR